MHSQHLLTGGRTSRVADAEQTVPIQVVAELLEALRDATDHQRASALGRARAAARDSGIVRECQAAGDRHAADVHAVMTGALTAAMNLDAVRYAIAALRERTAAERAELAELTGGDDA